MKIVLLSAGSSIHTVRWANGLADAGMKVHLINQHPLLESVDGSVEVHEFPYRGDLGYFTMVPRVKKLLKQIKPDVLNAHYASGYATTARLLGFHPWLLSVWGSDVYDFPYKSPVHKIWLRGNLMAADAVASTSHCMAEQTRTIAPTLKDISITPFGVDSAYFADTTTSLRSRSDSDPLVVGTVKTLAVMYGVDTLIDAFALVRDRLTGELPDIVGRLRLRLVGDGPQRVDLEQQAHKLGITSLVDFVGRVPYQQVPVELEKLDIYVALSRSESFGVAVIEAGAAARPVVVSNAGGLPEVVINGKTGFVVPRDNPRAAAEVLMVLIKDKALRIRLGEAGQKHVKEKYDWSACVQNMVRVLERTSQLKKIG